MNDPSATARRPISNRSPGAAALIHLLLLRTASFLLRHSLKRGFGRVVDTIGRVFPGQHDVVVEAFPGRLLSCSMEDGYWLAHLLGGYSYEPEVRHALDAVIEDRSIFVDCGANIGYWSVYVSTRLPATNIFAVEASKHVLPYLERNSSSNGQAYQVVDAAVWHESDAVVDFLQDRRRHSWGSAAVEVRDSLTSAGFQRRPVRTVTLDDLLIDSDDGPVILKIDVEGAELQVLEGAEKTLARDVLIIYEEHGRQNEAVVTRYLVEQKGMTILRWDGVRGFVRCALDDVVGILSDRAHGYNFFACPRDSQTLVRLSGVGPSMRSAI